MAGTSQENSGQAGQEQNLGVRSKRLKCWGQWYKHSTGISASAWKTELLIHASFSSSALSEVKRHKTQCRMSPILKVLLSRQFQSMSRTIRSEGCEESGDFFVAWAKKIIIFSGLQYALERKKGWGRRKGNYKDHPWLAWGPEKLQGPCWRPLKPCELHGSARESLASDLPKPPIFPSSQESRNISREL